MVSLWSSTTSMGEPGNSEIFSSVARSYLYSFLPVVPLGRGRFSKRVWLWRIKSSIPVKVGVICREGQ